MSRNIAVLAYKVGWEPKGWLPQRPWVGVSTFLRAALFALARPEGWGTETSGEDLLGRLPQPSAFWDEGEFRAFGALHPMEAGAKDTLGRCALGLLERQTESSSLLKALPRDALHWRYGAHDIRLTPDELFGTAAPRDLRRQLKAAGATLRPNPAAGERWLTTAPLQLRLWSAAWLSQLEEVMRAGQLRWKVRLLSTDPLPVLALWDALELLEGLCRLYGLNWHVPTVELDVPKSAELAMALEAYQGGAVGGTPSRSLLTPLTLTALERADVIIGPVEDVDVSELERHRDTEDLYQRALKLMNQMDLPFTQTRAQVAERPTLDFFFARFFAHPRLRDEQVEAVQRILGGNALLVLLPTGYGKSVIFQLVALLQPGVTLVVSPLVALIKDQVAHLQHNGIVGVGSVTGTGNQAKTYEAFENGHYRLFYCAPERFDTTAFKQAVANVLDQQRCSLIAIDEAHCVSEWGHDFRPAYMHIKNMRRHLETLSNHPVPLVALTATASPVVRADIQRALGIAAEHVVQTRSSDRPELSYSVHVVDGRRGKAGRLRALQQVFQDVAPKLFGEGALTRQAADGRYENGSVVFTPFAAATTQALHGGNTAVVRNFLSQEVLESAPVGMYAATAPGQCPHCRGQDFYQHYGTYSCNLCFGTFKKHQIVREENWDDQLLRTQDDFLSSQLPILVSTKGFGMGIDKPNIRLVTHYVMSGSLEAYYQEAGRAGRSGEHAHVALVTVPPAQGCAETYFESGRLTSLRPDDALPLPCLRRNAKGFAALSCPYGLTELCDVAQQASFIQSSFPSASEDLTQLQDVFEELQERSTVRVGMDSSATNRALSRLQTLGLIKTYVKAGATFKVNWNRDWTPGPALEHLEAELLDFERLAGAPQGSVPALQAVQGKPLTKQEYVAVAGQALIDTLYSTVRSMRLYSLSNLYHYASLPQGQCRRVHLRRSFEVTPLGEDYRCGFCDTCQPDLNFGRSRAYTPVVLTLEEELGQTFEQLMAEFSTEQAQHFLQACQVAKLTSAFLGRSTYLLEQRPNDRGLLFVSAGLHALGGQAQAARQAAERLVGVLRRVGAPSEHIGEDLAALATWSPGLDITLYSAVGGPFDDALGRRLALEALQTRDPRTAQRLALAWKVQTLRLQAASLLPTAFTPLEITP